MIFLLDNYDSFTWNLFDYLRQLGSDVIVERNDAISPEDISKLNPDAIVISPGPKTPHEAGNLMDVIDFFHEHIPILGICLGYQGIGEYFGATLVRSKIPVHGKTSVVFHQHDPIFDLVPSQTEVMRYHSLNIKHIPEDKIKIIAQTGEGEPMALRHVSLPIYGLQFHPESILTMYGMQMLRNWYAGLHGRKGL
ncbi:MAG: aminodeoxychorismate/anthranilate synthase component II [Chitinophagales bacterium]|nr:aminodeoxychorismate/anthranilate synthase component II [Chitinophagales bacterium]